LFQNLFYCLFNLRKLIKEILAIEISDVGISLGFSAVNTKQGTDFSSTDYFPCATTIKSYLIQKRSVSGNTDRPLKEYLVLALKKKHPVLFPFSCGCI